MTGLTKARRPTVNLARVGTEPDKQCISHCCMVTERCPESSIWPLILASFTLPRGWYPELQSHILASITKSQVADYVQDLAAWPWLSFIFLEFSQAVPVMTAFALISSCEFSISAAAEEMPTTPRLSLPPYHTRHGHILPSLFCYKTSLKWLACCSGWIAGVWVWV